MVAFLPASICSFCRNRNCLSNSGFLCCYNTFTVYRCIFRIRRYPLDLFIGFAPFVFTLAYTVIFLPAFTVLDFACKVIFVTVCFMILILTLARTPLPSAAFAVIVTVFPAPPFLAVTTPLLFTVAYFVFEDDHTTFYLSLSSDLQLPLTSVSYQLQVNIVPV